MPRLLTGGAACYRIYETADGRHLTVAALEPKFWRNLCDLLDRPDLIDRAFDPSLPELGNCSARARRGLAATCSRAGTPAWARS